MTIRQLPKILLIFVVVFLPLCAAGADRLDIETLLGHRIIPRPATAMTGSAFAVYASTMDAAQREQAILGQILSGNFPEFLRQLKPIRFAHTLNDGSVRTATIFVMPDYLAIGSDDDFLLTPMSFSTATHVATHLGFILPTKRIVDAIFLHSDVRFAPRPLPPGPEMGSTAYYIHHNRMIEEQRIALGSPLDALVAGHKKDLVLTNRLMRQSGKIAIYGWHRPTGIPIQPLSTVHGGNYADYSHGARLISETMLIDGNVRSIYGVLEDATLAGLLSEEGPIPQVHALMLR